MKQYIAKRILLLIPTLFGISIVTFGIINMAPGSPANARIAQIFAGEASGQVTAELIEQTKKLYGLDKSLSERYWLWLKGMVTLDFGESFKDHRPVMDKIAEALPITIVLNILSMIVVYVLAIPWGVYSSRIAHSRLDRVVTIALFILYSLPTFWVATMLILFLGGGEFFDVFPTYGYETYGAEAWGLGARLWDWTQHLFLPLVCMSYGGLALLSRYARVSMLEGINQDYIRTARAKGLSEKVITLKHALRNSLLPLITLVASIFPALFGGSVIIETIFSISGLGKLGFEAIRTNDYPVVMAITTISAMLTLVGILISDLLYVVADPRISFESREAT